MPYDPNGAAAREAPAQATAPESPRVASIPPIRLRADPKTFKAAQDWEGFTPAAIRPRARRLTTTYFDSAAGDLAKAGLILHLRNHNRRHILTLVS